MTDRPSTEPEEARHRPTAAERAALRGPSVVAYTTEADDQAPVRRSAAAHARGHGCVLILYDADAASWISEPLPNQWASEGEGEHIGDRLDLGDLEYLGRAAVMEQVREARQAGTKAAAWLPKDHGPAAPAEYARAEDAHIVFVSERGADTEKLRGMLGQTATADGTTLPGIELRIVGADDSTGG